MTTGRKTPSGGAESGAGGGAPDSLPDPSGQTQLETVGWPAGTAGSSTPAGATRSAAEEGPGATIGRYSLVEEIGAGGFGAVFRAEQHQPVVRTVALKILKLGMDTRQVIARFEQERQALAVMDHPHIAKVLDAGTTEAGRPFFVMELVTGEPITTFCDAQGLPVRERLELLVQVCNAIQHAHQKGIIHRDIKPSNVLVSRHDGRPHAKVIDFGIAKAVEQRPEEPGVHTQLGQFVGTPLYMSPEQSAGSLDIDTRSDVYSLGVLLYELLTGTTPFDPATLRDASFADLQRVIREVDPPRPSTRVSAASQITPEVAARRSTETRRLTSALRGELDWIAMKALEKERQRRYQTANGLAMDIERYLAGEPVAAAPPSTSYRLAKFVTRHKGPVSAAAIVALVLVAGLAGTLWQARAAARQRDVARSEAKRATALNDFMAQMLTASDPELAGSRDVTVLELLAKASETASRTLQGEPLAEAEARTLLGNTFRSLGKMDQAVTELERAVALREGGAGSDTLAHSRSLRALALAVRERGDHQAALALYQRARDIVERLGEAHQDELLVVTYELGQTYSRLSRYAEAEQHYDRSDQILARLPGVQAGNRGLILAERAVLAEYWKGDLAEAERLSTASLAEHRRGDQPWLVADGLNSLAVIKTSRGQFDEAIALYREAIDLARRIFGEAHPQVALKLENLGNVYFRRKQFDQTLALLEEALEIRQSTFGAASFPVARTRFNMGAVALESGDFARGRELFESALPVFREHAGDGSLEVAIALNYRGRSAEGLEDPAAALRDYRAALALLDVLGVPSAETRLNTLLNLARLQCKRGSADARGTIDLALGALEAKNPDHQKWFDRFGELRASCRSAP